MQHVSWHMDRRDEWQRRSFIS